MKEFLIGFVCGLRKTPDVYGIEESRTLLSNGSQSILHAKCSVELNILTHSNWSLRNVDGAYEQDREIGCLVSVFFQIGMVVITRHRSRSIASMEHLLNDCYLWPCIEALHVVVGIKTGFCEFVSWNKVTAR